jgi:hypothetical protein
MTKILNFQLSRSTVNRLYRGVSRATAWVLFVVVGVIVYNTIINL